jgi:hypothetical protein
MHFSNKMQRGSKESGDKSKVHKQQRMADYGRLKHMSSSNEHQRAVLDKW